MSPVLYVFQLCYILLVIVSPPFSVSVLGYDFVPLKGSDFYLWKYYFEIDSVKFNYCLYHLL